MFYNLYIRISKPLYSFSTLLPSTMVATSETIKISKPTKQLLDNSKIHHRETYDDVIRRAITKMLEAEGKKVEFNQK